MGDQTVEEWLISEGYCYAGALAQVEDFALYAAAPVADDVGWGFVNKEDHEEDILQDDMSTKRMTIGEVACLKGAVEKGVAPAGGFWLGGVKYSITQFDPEFSSGDHTFVTV